MLLLHIKIDTSVSTAKSATDLKLPHIFKVGITILATKGCYCVLKIKQSQRDILSSFADD